MGISKWELSIQSNPRILAILPRTMTSDSMTAVILSLIIEVTVQLFLYNYCSKYNATSAYVLGMCLPVHRAHRNVKSKITKILREEKYIYYDEVYGINSEGLPGFFDIIVFY